MITYTILLSLLLFTPQEFLNLYNYQSHTSHEVALHLDEDEWSDFKARVSWSPLDVDEQLIGAALLNDELSEYVTKATIYKPSGDKITFE